MSIGAWGMLVIVVLSVAALGFVVFSMLRSIRNERTAGRSVWREFGLGISLMLLFFVTWVAQAFAEWQTYTDDQRSHGEPITAGDFTAHFAQSTLENWQSEFLQLFTFVALAALYIHKGSAESKDGEERLEAALRRIEERLGTVPGDAPTDTGNEWKLPETPLQAEDRALGRGPEGGRTRDELYEIAREQDVAGRSTMTKEELEQAVDLPPEADQ